MRSMRPLTIAILASLAIAMPSAGQTVSFGAGLAWRGGGDYLGFAEMRRDAVSVDLRLSRRTTGIGWMVGVGTYLGDVGEVDPDCPNPPPGQSSPCHSKTTHPGVVLAARGGVVFTPIGERIEVAAGPSLIYAPGLRDPTQTSLAASATLGVTFHPFARRPMGLGIEATRLFSPIGAVRWLVSPRIEFSWRLR